VTRSKKKNLVTTPFLYFEPEEDVEARFMAIAVELVKNHLVTEEQLKAFASESQMERIGAEISPCPKSATSSLLGKRPRPADLEQNSSGPVLRRKQ
jgi:hypothetical protein